jgi:hypothetical protein
MEYRVRVIGGRVVRQIAVSTVTGDIDLAGVEDSRAEKQLDDRRRRVADLLSVVLCRPMVIVGWAGQRRHCGL